MGADLSLAPPPWRRSLKLRLLSLSLGWLLFSLLATGFVLVLLFRADTQQHFDDALRERLQDLAAAARVDADGRLSLVMAPADPRFQAPLSGWYWELRASGDVSRSPSLAGQDLPAPPGAPNGVEVFDNLPGPAGVRLRMAAQDLPTSGGVVSVRVAGPCVTVRSDVLAYMGWLAAALGTLGLTLGGLIVSQIVYGLRPLKLVRDHLAHIRLGRRDRLGLESPAEIAPLIQELDALLEERDRSVAEALAEAGELAHALKTPLAVIRNEARAPGPASGATIAAEADRMARVVEHHLVKARSAVEKRRRNARASVDRVFDDLRFTLSRLYPERRLVIVAPKGLTAACNEDDLGEMLGNLADNAGKWARATVRISAARDGERLRFEIADDGAGLKAHEREQVLEHGCRLDERAPGHGLGLSIAAKLAALYAGTLRLERSRLGGLAVIVELPVAAG